jgi:adiponectin receptor
MFTGFEVEPDLFFWYLGGASYVFGGLIYILRFPEKCRPGKHDILGSSHQIFHFFVLFGVFFHFLGCLDAYHYRLNNPCYL